MQYKLYRRAKRVDLFIQAAVVVLLLMALGSTPGWNFFIGFLLLGVVQVLSWLIWLFATPRPCWNIGRIIYSVLLVIAFIVMYLVRRSMDSSSYLRNELFEFMMISGTLLGIFYLVVTIIESNKQDEPFERPGLSMRADG